MALSQQRAGLVLEEPNRKCLGRGGGASAVLVLCWALMGDVPGGTKERGSFGLRPLEFWEGEGVRCETPGAGKVLSVSIQHSVSSRLLCLLGCVHCPWGNSSCILPCLLQGTLEAVVKVTAGRAVSFRSSHHVFFSIHARSNKGAMGNCVTTMVHNNYSTTDKGPAPKSSNQAPSSLK